MSFPRFCMALSSFEIQYQARVYGDSSSLSYLVGETELQADRTSAAYAIRNCDVDSLPSAEF